jgi:uncharacterized protein (DUF362 family)
MLSNFSRRMLLQMTAFTPAIRAVAAAQAVTTNPNPAKSVVSLVHGEERRKNIRESLIAIDDQILPVLKRKKYVVIKPNNVSTTKQLASTHADALRGILDYLEPRFKGPVYIAESSAGETMDGFEEFQYPRVASEHRKQQVKLIDLNAEGTYKTIPLINFDLHPVEVRLAARLMDPDAFVICSAILKTHNTVVATLSVKNMTLGAPLHQPPKETKKWNDKRKYHNGVRQTHFNMFLTAKAMKPFWGATVIDGYEGMEGNGPASGTPVPSRVAIASTDYIAADRVGIEAMGVNPEWMGYLKFCHDFKVGQFDLNQITVRGEKVEKIVKKYAMHKDIERELQWMGTIADLPPKLG